MWQPLSAGSKEPGGAEVRPEPGTFRRVGRRPLHEVGVEDSHSCTMSLLAPGAAREAELHFALTGIG